MIALIISLLLSLGVIDSPDTYYNASADQQAQYNSIVIEDINQ